MFQNFLSQHPGGELATLTFEGKDATAVCDMIHPPEVRTLCIHRRGWQLQDQ